MPEVLVLKKRKDFVRVAAKGVRVATSTLILQAAQNLSTDNQFCRVGYTTTKKIGKAHIRNRTRRRMRAEDVVYDVVYLVHEQYARPYERYESDDSQAHRVGGEELNVRNKLVASALPEGVDEDLPHEVHEGLQHAECG